MHSRKKSKPRSHDLTRLRYESLESRILLVSDLLISEIMADNTRTLADEDGHYEDWIEIYNKGEIPVSLRGWSLTDDTTDLQKWRFPDRLLGPSEYLIVFASGKSRSQPTAELHTNFSLNADGEYLALVQPDGTTLASEFSPQFPAQREDRSHGILQQHVSTKLISETSAVDILVPTKAEDLASHWGDASFNTGDWTAGPKGSGIGFEDRFAGGFNQYATTILEDKPTSYWHLSEAASPVQDSATNGLVSDNGAFVDGVVPQQASHWIGERANGDASVRLDGKTGYIEISDSDDLQLGTGDFTISLWAKKDSANRRVLLNKRAGVDDYFEIEWQISNNIQLDVVVDDRQRVDISSTTPLMENVWYHIAFSVDRDSLTNSRVYINGIDDTGSVVLDDGDVSIPGAPLHLGRRTDNSQRFWDGLIDEVAIFKEALSAERIAAQVAAANVTDGDPATGVFGSLIATDVTGAMSGKNASAFVRIPFSISDIDAVDRLMLRMRYDDGFVAYLNGELIAQRNAPASPAWDSTATASRIEWYPNHVAATQSEQIDISSHLSQLQAGEHNVLAIQGLNVTRDDADFLISAELFSTEVTTLDTNNNFATPSPGVPNRDPLVADPELSVHRGIFSSSDTDAFAVEIRTSTPGATIVYTTDGSTPSLTNGNAVTGINGTPPIAMVSINETTTLRAGAFHTDLLPSNFETHTYIFLDSVLAQPSDPVGFPEIWRRRTADYAMEQDPTDLALIAGDPRMTEEQYNAVITDSLLSLPTMSIVMDNEDLFGTRGIYSNTESRGTAWERPASLEYILPDGTRGFQIDAGLQIMGGTSRNPTATPKHSMRLLFKNQYGPGRLDYPLFPEAEVESFNSIALRANIRDGWPINDRTYAAGPNSTYIRDQWAKASQAAMGQPATAGKFVHLYLNGLYWGLYNPTERPDAAFLADRIGGDDSDYDTVKFCCPQRAVDGSIEKWNQLLSLSQQGLVSDTAYQFIQGNNPDGTRNENYEVLIDVDSFIDYVINGQYHGSLDWPGNYYAVRDQRAESEGFKFFTWDNDLAFPKSDVNKDKSTSTNDVGFEFWWTDSPGVIDMALRQNAEYRLRFADRVQRHLFHDGIYTPRAAAELWSTLADQIKDAVVAESARWGDWLGPQFTPSEHWQPAVDNMLENYFPFRTDIVLDQMRSHGLYPHVDAPVFEVNGFEQHGGEVGNGDQLSIAGADGTTVYFTADGSDPRSGPEGISWTPWVQFGNSTRFHVPTNESLGPSWTATDFDDSEWPNVTGPIGFGSRLVDDFSTNISENMYRQNATVYARVEFDADDIAQTDRLRLRLDVDDGFVAYLNGIEVARNNAPDDLSFESRAEVDVRREPTDTVLNLTSHLPILKPQGNVLAIHGLNSRSGSRDFLIAPVLEGGVLKESSLSKSAELYSEPLRLEATSTVQARAFSKGEWSALAEATFTRKNPLRIDEIMYHPAAPSASEQSAGFNNDDDFEYIEIVNPGKQSINLKDIRFVRNTDNSQGVSFDFSGSLINELAPGDRVLVVEDLAAFETRYGSGLPVAGQWTGQLSNRGETITLVSSDQTIQQFSYEDSWNVTTDGGGYSLQVVNAHALDLGQWSLAEGWRSSLLVGGTPGNGPPISADINNSGRIDAADIDLLSAAIQAGSPEPQFDLNVDERVDDQDRNFLIHNVLRTNLGDTNLDGVFDSSDLVLIWQNNEYEDGIASNSGWAEGDWNGDGEFDSGDLVAAFSSGAYRSPIAAAVDAIFINRSRQR